MAASLVNSANVLSSTTNTTSYTSSNYTPASTGNVLVISLMGYNDLSSGSSSISTITLGGVDISGDIQATQNSSLSGQRGWSRVYVLVAPSTSAQAVAVTTGNTLRALAIDITEWSGIDTTTPVASTATDNGATDTTAVLSFTVAGAGNVLVGSTSVDGGAKGPFTPNSGTTEVTAGQTGGTSFNDNSYSTYYKIAASSGADTIGTTFSSSYHATAGVELALASAGGANTSNFFQFI